MESFSHKPVMLEECMEALAIHPDGIYVDGTVGGAGHSLEIAKRLGQGGRLIALDKDPDALEAAARRLQEYSNARVVQRDFAGLTDVLDGFGISQVDGILLDLGVSSYQLDTPERGFSYKQDAPLDMRMTKAGTSARDIVNTYGVQELCRIFRDYGEERFALPIAKAILRAREKAPIERTGELVELIREAIPAKARRTGGHPAKRVFQAIRIEVNGELESLRTFLDTAFERLNVGGRLAVITFQSLEDRMVKQAFGAWCEGCTCPPDFPVCVCGRKPRAKIVGHKKSMVAGAEELAGNSRSKSARLRAVEKLSV